MLIDSHAHLNSEEFAADRAAVIQRTLQAEIEVINVGSDLPSSQLAVKLAKDYPGLYAAVGLHPEHAANLTEEEVEQTLKIFWEILSVGAAVAVGEIGLDYFRLTGESLKNKQQEILEQQLRLAKSFSSPLILHARGEKNNPSGAYQDLLRLIKSLDYSRGVLHCFTADWEIAKKYLDQGFYLGFTGIITFKKTEYLAEVAKKIPADRMLIETDAPFLAPEPFRGRRNEPAYVLEVAKKMAEIRNISLTEVSELTTENAQKLFSL